MRRILFEIKKKMWQVPQLVFISAIIFISMTAFIWLTHEDSEILIKYSELVTHFVILCICMIVYKLISRIYGTLFNYGETRKYELILLSASIIFAALTIISAIYDIDTPLPYKVISIALCIFTLYLLLLCFYRLLLRKGAKAINKNLIKNYKHIAIIGAGEAGIKLFEEIRENPESKYRVWCFLDDDNKIIGRKIHGVSIKGPIKSIADILKDSPVSEVVLAIPSLDDSRRQEILNLCSQLPYSIKILPNSSLILQEKKKFATSLRSIKLDDILGRTAINFNREELEPFLEGKVILVTGGGGSIGSELCRQISTFKPSKLIIFDIIENTAYLLKSELDYASKGSLDIVIEIGSICDPVRMNRVFETYNPDIVFHAAAHKHVPLMEHNPSEAVKTNIIATYKLAKLSAKYNCEKFVMLSTDKAVNPTNVMGASKRYCEMIIQAMEDIPDCKTDFVAVRFGNVLGSNGSVVPLFISQIEQGGPITLTDKRIIRYFMTISEAASLVLEAGAMAKNSEIYVLDMGEPVQILTLAENLIRIAGYIPYKDIDIVETGLRPGEKLYEELLVNEDKSTKIATQKIFVEKQNERIRLAEIEYGIYQLDYALATEDNRIITSTLKKLVPTFKSPEEVNSNVKDTLEIFKKVSCSA